jgi:serine/threonine protein kinase
VSLHSIADELGSYAERSTFVAAESKAGSTFLPAPEFLAALERSGALPDAQWRELRDRFAQAAGLRDSLAIAHQLIEEGVLTEFQARRLLRGKRGIDFGRYVLLDDLGRGARGRVYKARHRLMDRVVALKVLLPGDSLSETAVSRFFREMKIVGRLDHPNVVRAIDADVHEGCPYIVMEYLEGSDLEQVWVRRSPLAAADVIEYMVQVSRGLAHAHEQGVIHRDIKPTNVFLLKTGIVKILDLGFGELVGQAGQPSNVFDTDEGVVVGTTDFMSPEQVKDKPIDARTDLFSLGCTMYRLLTGEYAFPGITREDRLVKRIKEPHVPITDVRPGLPEGLVAIVDRLLAIRPDDRFGSAAEVADALEAMSPAAGRPERAAGAKSPAKGAGGALSARPSEPEAPLDWSRIVSALRPSGYGSTPSPGSTDRNEPKGPKAKRLASHRQSLEGEGDESGREVHKQYRNELIQMNRAMAELQSTESEAEPPPVVVSWLSRLGEKLGDFLAEPTASPILVLVVLAVLAGVALLLAVAFG